MQLTIYACEILHDRMHAEDIVHDVFLQLYEKKLDKKIKSITGNYLYRAVYSRCINALEHKNVRLKHDKNIHDEIHADPENPLEIVKYIEFERKFHDAMELLPARCRQVFTMSRIEGLKNKEIAEQLSISKRTVETQISQALKTLKKRLIKYLPVILLIIVMYGKSICFFFKQFFYTCI